MITPEFNLNFTYGPQKRRIQRVRAESRLFAMIFLNSIETEARCWAESTRRLGKRESLPGQLTPCQCRNGWESAGGSYAYSPFWNADGKELLCSAQTSSSTLI